MKHLLLTTITAVLLVCAGACTAFATEQFLNKKIDLCSKTSVELKKLKNKENIEARIRFAAYNVLFGLWAKPKSIGEMFKQYDLDVICFNEVPNGDWTARVGRVLGMDHVHVGKVSSANHRNKYKSILCRFPLFDKREVTINAKGWKPASLVSAKANIKGVPLMIYSTHIPGQLDAEGSAAAFIAKNLISSSVSENLFILGDFNNHLNEGALKSFNKVGVKSIWKELPIDTLKISTHKHIESGNESGVIDHIFFRTKTSKVNVTRGGIISSAFNSPEAELQMKRYKKEWLKYGKPLSDHRPIWAEFIFCADNSKK
ncbi:endonuclease/exonuclease/phosphatase family protein [bacterium]|nr:endonuclease/exonuclease/phosphatase family protein [bacterium]